jgi:hypothetical protein
MRYKKRTAVLATVGGASFSCRAANPFARDCFQNRLPVLLMLLPALPVWSSFQFRCTFCCFALSGSGAVSVSFLYPVLFPFSCILIILHKMQIIKFHTKINTAFKIFFS